MGIKAIRMTCEASKIKLPTSCLSRCFYFLAQMRTKQMVISMTWANVWLRRLKFSLWRIVLDSNSESSVLLVIQWVG
jgi:hypothetical protein